MRNLTLPQRRTLEALCKQKLSQAEMARRLGVHRSTVCRELKRNTFYGVYQCEPAHYTSHARKRIAGTENQKERRRIFLDPHAQAIRHVRFSISMRNRDIYAMSFKVYPYRRRRGFRFRFDFGKRRDKRKFRPWKKFYFRYCSFKLRTSHYLRDHSWENFKRTPRSAWKMRKYRKPHHSIARIRNYSRENTKRAKLSAWQMAIYRRPITRYSTKKRNYAWENIGRIRPPYWKTAHYYKAYHKKHYSYCKYSRPLYHPPHIDTPGETTEPVPQVASVPEEVRPVTKRRARLKPVPLSVPACRMAPLKPRPKAWRRTRTRAHSPPT